MTALDRAIIRAFAEAGHATVGVNHRPMPRAKTARAAQLQMAKSAAIEMMSSTTPLVDSPPVKSSAPMAPLSSYTATPYTAIEISSDAFRPLLEVDQFAWPPACHELLLQSDSVWNEFATQIVEEHGGSHACIAIASCLRGEGRTTVTLSVGKLLAARGLRTVIVDADIDNPTLAHSCGISPQIGWDDIVDGELPLGEAMIASLADGVTLMPWRKSQMTMAQLASLPQTETSFGLLRQNYDLVLLDAMPLAGHMDAGELANLAAAIRLDAVYLVYDARSSDYEQLASVSAKLQRAGVRIGGLIENFVAPLAESEQLPAELSEVAIDAEIAANH